MQLEPIIHEQQRFRAMAVAMLTKLLDKTKQQGLSVAVPKALEAMSDAELWQFFAKVLDSAVGHSI